MPIIINGGSRRAGGWWAAHLGNKEKNDRVEVVELVGLSAETMPEAFREMQAVARGTKCENYFYQANINPREDEQLTPAQWREAVDTLEKNLGLTGQPRFVVEHEKNGRVHRHVVWSRIDAKRMTAISDSLTAAIHERTSRELEIRFDLERGRSILVPDREFERPERRPKKHETIRALDSGIDPSTVKAEISALWRSADTAHSFKAALETSGNYVLARGDRRDFVVIDRAGDDHSLARRVGVKAAELRTRMKDIDPASLPSVAEARTMQKDRAAARAAGIERTMEPAANWDRDADTAAWMDKVAEAGIAKDATARAARKGRRQAEPSPAAKPQEAARGRYAALQPSAAAETKPDRPLGKMTGQIRMAWSLSRTGDQLEEALAVRGMTLAQVNAEEARASERRAAFAKAIGNFLPAWREGEIVVVDGYGTAHRLNERTTGERRPEIEGRLAGIDRAALLSVTAAKEAMREASRITARDQDRQWRDMQRPVTGIERTIAEALTNTMTGTEFAAAIDRAGFAIGRATAADVLALEALRKDAALTATASWTENVSNRGERHFSRLTEGDYAAVTRRGDVIRLNPTALDFEEVEQRLADTQRRMPSVVEARAGFKIERERTAALWEQRRADNMIRKIHGTAAREADQAMRGAARGMRNEAQKTIATTERVLFKTTRAALRVASSTLSGLGDMLGGLFEFFSGPSKPPTREEAKRIERAADEHATELATRAVVEERSARLDDLLDQIARNDAQQRALRYSRSGGAGGYDRPVELDDDYGRER